MSLLIINITEDHIKLLKGLKWSINANNFIVGTEDEFIDKDFGPFGSNNLYEGIDLILNGNTEEFNPLKEDVKVFTELEIAKMDKLYLELPMALEVVLTRQSFETGEYVSSYHDRNWKKKS